MTYATLKADVASWLVDTTSTDKIPSFVLLAESAIRRDVRVPAMDATLNGSLAAGVIALPDDFIEVKRLVIDGYVHEFKPVDVFQQMETDGYTTSGSSGRYYTRIGTGLRVLGGGSAAYSLLYVAKFSTLALDEDSNWLLENAPDVYLFKTLHYGAAWLRDKPAAESYEVMYQGAVNALVTAERMSQFSGPLSMNVSGA